MRGMESSIHPDEEQIDRFVLGQGSPEENRTVTLHLLRGCPECQALARAAWYRTESQLARLILLPAGHGAPRS